MAFSYCKKDGEGSHSNPSQPNKFFKIILHPQDNSLEIPTRFVKKWGQKLPDKVTLKAPNGSVRQVKLVHSIDGESFFHEGWKDFKDYYSIGFGNMLMFVYDGNSHFDVHIFDMTTSEIEYPITIVREHINESDSESELESESDDSQEGKENCVEVKGHLSKCKKSVKTQTVDRETCSAYQKAQAFKTDNPSFKSLMQPSYVSSRVVLKIPTSFAREHLFKQRNTLTLRMQDGRTRTVMCNLGTRAYLTTGWKEFVMENGLKVGQACVFEVNESDKSLWNVTIFRN